MGDSTHGDAQYTGKIASDVDVPIIGMMDRPYAPIERTIDARDGLPRLGNHVVAREILTVVIASRAQKETTRVDVGSCSFKYKWLGPLGTPVIIEPMDVVR